MVKSPENRLPDRSNPLLEVRPANYSSIATCPESSPYVTKLLVPRILERCVGEFHSATFWFEQALIHYSVFDPLAQYVPKNLT